MGLIDADRWDISQAETLKAGPFTRYLEEPVNLALTDPAVLGTMGQPQPVQYVGRV